jgi:DNA-binding SARP family transcriptional activator
MTRARSVGTGLTALALLTSAVVGLPFVLYRFGGSPLPRRMPSWHVVMAALSSQDSGGLLVAIIRDCSWLAWLLFTACVLAEALAVIRGCRPPYLRLGGLQGAAANLVALAGFAFAAPSTITLSASVAAATSLGTAPATASRSITVRSGDCLWSIAQSYLGAGDRYPAIVSLNYGREMGEGQVFTNPSLIEPGWRLFLPGHGPDAPPRAERERSQHSGHPTRDPYYRRRHPPAGQYAARQHVATGQHATTGPHAAAGQHAAKQAAARQPAAMEPADASEAAHAAGRPDNGSAGHTGIGEWRDPAVWEAGTQTSGSAEAARDQLSAAAMFAAGGLAGAVLTTLARMRWRQRQERMRGRRIALPADQDVLAAEQRLRAAALPQSRPGQTEPVQAEPVQAEPVQTLRDALACLEAGIVAAGQPLPDIVGLHVTPDVLEVLLAAPAADGPPAPYAISPGRQGMCWQLKLPAVAPAPGDPASHGESASGLANLGCHLLPGLFTAGTTGDGYLLLDLESLQVTCCDGPPGLVDQVIVTTATELATAQWSSWFDLILVGCDELESLGRADHCATLTEALSLIETRRAGASARTAERAPPDLREFRLAEPDNEDWGLTILISRLEPDPDQMTRLLGLVVDGAGGIGALVAGDTEAPDGRMAPVVLQVAPDPEEHDGIVANILPFQITVRPRALSAANYAAITTLFAMAGDVDDVAPDAEPYAVYAAPPWIPQAAALHPPVAADITWLDELEVHHPAEPPRTGTPAASARQFAAVSHQLSRAEPGAGEGLQVRILGPFAITGAVEPLQPKQAELVLALALAAPAGLSNSALCAMLGADPDHPKPADAVRQVITRARRRLGPARDGQEYIVHVGNGHYAVHPDVTLDWSVFRELVASGRAEDLRAAVPLIGGQPFTGSYFWWIDIPLIETVRAELVDVADALAEIELAAGSPRAAARAARAGLLADPSAEQLWRAVMRAEHAAGNLAGVTEAWRRCLDAIEDIAPDGEPHADTVALYRQLTISQPVPAR